MCQTRNTIFMLWIPFCAPLDWSVIVNDIANRYFDAPVILFFDFSSKNIRNFEITPQKKFFQVDQTLKILNQNWSFLVANDKYENQRREISVNYRLKLTHVRQIIATIEEYAVLDEKLLGAQISQWRQNFVWFGRAKILVILECEKNLSTIASTIFLELWNQVKAVNVAVLFMGKSSYKIFKSAPYSTCCQVQVKSTDILGMFQVHKLKNLNFCKVTTIPATLLPYVLPPNDKNIFYEGLEVRFLQELSRILNFSLGFASIPIGQSPWMSLINGTVPAGMMGVLYRAEADVSLSGNRLTYIRTQYVEHIESYFSDDFAWIGPIASKTPRWKSVFLVFRPFIWLSIFTVFLTTLFLLNYLKIQLSKSFTIIWAATLNVGVSNIDFNQPRTKFIIIGYLFYAIIITTMFTSGLFQVLTNGLKLTTINTPMEGVKAGLLVSMFLSSKSEIQEGLPEFMEYATKHNLAWYTYRRFLTLYGDGSGK